MGKQRKTSDAGERYFTLDKSFVAQEAREGMRTFLAPLSGVYRAATTGRFVDEKKPPMQDRPKMKA